MTTLRKFSLAAIAAAFALSLAAFPAHAADEAASDGVTIGGALRLNGSYLDWSDASKDKGGDFAFELFRLNASGEVKEFDINVEYRFYPEWDMHMLHHGYIGYDLMDEAKLQLGVQQVPFGILPYASHNFWFSGAYYIGFEDDYDTGVALLYERGPFDFRVAFFKNAEYGSASNLKRYSVDLVKEGDYSSEETNQVNARFAYTLTHAEDLSTELGASMEFGQMYDSVSEDTGSRWAVAAHAVGNYGGLNVQLEAATYKYSPEYPDGVDEDIVHVGAFGAAWDIPAKASFLTANVAYTLPVNMKLLDSITVYNDNTVIEPDDDDKFERGIQNVFGAMLASGPVYTYIDYISAENMPFMGGTFVGGDGKRHGRVNLNVGYYF